MARQAMAGDGGWGGGGGAAGPGSGPAGSLSNLALEKAVVEMTALRRELNAWMQAFERGEWAWAS